MEVNGHREQRSSFLDANNVPGAMHLEAASRPPLTHN
jgi:hypothetical protein